MNQEAGRERLQFTPPLLRDVLIQTVYAERRTFPSNVHALELGVFADEAKRMHELSENNTKYVGSHVLVDHATDKVLLFTPTVSDDGSVPIKVNINFDPVHKEYERKFRQDRSLALLLITSDAEKVAIRTIARLLLDEDFIASPAGIFVVTPDGSHLFFRTAGAIEQTIEENEMFVRQTQYTSMKEFAKQYQLLHFFCPNGETIATPALL